MTSEPPPDYTTMSGAEFQRAVGTDPAKWAEAFIQKHRVASAPADWMRDVLPDWFRDAMEAARKDRIGRVLGEGEVHGP